MKKLVLLIAISVISTKSFSQSINYTIIENNPDKKNFYVFLNPFNAQAYMADISIGIDANVNYWINNRFQADVDFRKAYTDAEVRLFSPKGLPLASQFQAGICFNLVNKLKNINNKVILSSTTAGRYTFTESITVKAEARRMMGLRGGLQYFHNNYKIGNDITKAPGADDIQAKDTHGNLYPVFDNSTFETINYIARSYGVYAGFDLKTIRDVVIDADGYGTKSSKKISNVYLDALLAPLMVYTLKPNDHQLSTYKDTDINIKENKRKVIGWRLGWQYAFNNTVGFNMKTEIGQQPGPAVVGSFFLTFGIGLNFGVKIKSFDKTKTAS